MKNGEMKIVYKKVEDIIPYDGNPRNNSGAVEKVAESIKEFGFKVPIVLDKDSIIVTGHTRLKAAVNLGLDEVPCIYADDLTPAQIKAYRLADNKVSEFAEWDDAKLELEMLDLDELGFNLERFGFELGFDDEEEKEKQEKERNLESMELKAFEHYDYLVFVFDNQMDWLNVCNEFKLHKVDAGYGKTKKIGIGRVLRGKELLERMGHSTADPEQGQEHDDYDA